MAAMNADTYEKDSADLRRTLKTLEWMLRILIVEAWILSIALTAVTVLILCR